MATGISNPMEAPEQAQGAIKADGWTPKAGDPPGVHKGVAGEGVTNVGPAPTARPGAQPNGGRDPSSPAKNDITLT